MPSWSVQILTHFWALIYILAHFLAGTNDASYVTHCLLLNIGILRTNVCCNLSVSNRIIHTILGIRQALGLTLVVIPQRTSKACGLTRRSWPGSTNSWARRCAL